MVTNHTIEEREALLGLQVQQARIAANLDQERLAALANVSVNALSNLERGKGSSLKTLIAVVRALDRTDWLEALAPSVTLSPLRMLRDKQRNRPRVRVRARNASSNRGG